MIRAFAILSLAFSLISCRGSFEETADESTGSHTSTTYTEFEFIPTKWPGWSVTVNDTETYSNAGYVIQRWEVDATAANYFETLMGSQRAFYLLKPKPIVEGDHEIPLLVFLHGGAVDDDSGPEYYDDDPYATKCGLANNVAAGVLNEPYTQNQMIVDRGWAMVVPENLWCDFWIGRGESDPVDQVNHRGYEHTAEVIDFLRAGGGGFLPSEVYLWGSSSGGAAALPIAHWYRPQFDGIISDSPPCNMVEYYDTDKSSLIHIFGGAPYIDNGTKESKWIQNYLDASCNWLIAEDGFDTPVFLAYNSLDILTQTYNTYAMSDALDKHYPVIGQRYGHHDFNHEYPGFTYHTQVRNPGIPATYTTEMMLRFLEGKTLIWTEAEEQCNGESCGVGIVLSNQSDSGFAWEQFSASAGRKSEDVEGSGMVLREQTPAQLPNSAQVTATLIVKIKSDNDLADDTDVLTLRYRDDGGADFSTTIVVGDLALTETIGSYNNSDLMRHVTSTELTFVPTDPATGMLTAITTGDLTLYLDGVVYQYSATAQ